MERLEINIAEAEFANLNSLYPPTVKSSTVGARALALVKIHFRVTDPTCSFRENVEDCDLEVTSRGNVTRVEVKGTADQDVAWSKLKINGTPSHGALLAGMPLYRVVGVYERNPAILVLRYGIDFTTVPEPRWGVKRAEA
ncbi:hypothetical protein [Rheinheimera sp.]|uniref:hypothetical protein n=1 Tax=Rheinheimera sp. TaxID=1869214 RepID=UPI003AF726B3